MAERQPDDDQPVRDRTDEDEEFEDIDTEDEDESFEDEGDEDVVDEERSMPQDRNFTAEIGSEGGSRGTLETERDEAGISRGSEATETGRPGGSVRGMQRRPGGQW